MVFKTILSTEVKEIQLIRLPSTWCTLLKKATESKLQYKTSFAMKPGKQQKGCTQL